MKYFMPAALLMLGCSGLAWGQSAAHPHRLHFKKGATRITVRGYLKSLNDSANYLLSLRAHQTIRVETCEQSISLRNDVLNSAGQSADNTDLQGNSGIDDTAAGDYRVVVIASGKDDRRQGKFCISIEVTEHKLSL